MEDIGVPINQTKSVIAKIPAVEYLKVTTLRTKNVSALSWRMLISNNSFMGRINTVYTLLDRDYIGKGGIINWLLDTTCQAVGKGNINLTLFAVLTKFYKSGAISLANVFESVVDAKDQTKSLKSNIIKGVNKDYLSLLVSSLIKKTPLRLRQTVSCTSTLHWITEYMKHKMKIEVSVFKDSQKLAYDVVHWLYPDQPVYKLEEKDRPRYTALQAAFLQLFWDEVTYPLLRRLDRPVPYLATLEESFEYTESLDRYWETKSILDRAIQKLTDDVPVPKKPKFTMNLISMALKAESWRKELEAKKMRASDTPNAKKMRSSLKHSRANAHISKLLGFSFLDDREDSTDE